VRFWSALTCQRFGFALEKRRQVAALPNGLCFSLPGALLLHQWVTQNTFGIAICQQTLF